MTPEEILRDARDMAASYPGDRLRLTGEEVLDLVAFVAATTPTILTITRESQQDSTVELKAHVAVLQEALQTALKDLSEMGPHVDHSCGPESMCDGLCVDAYYFSTKCLSPLRETLAKSKKLLEAP